MKLLLQLLELIALLITCVGFAIGFNATHNALTYIHAEEALDEATRLLEQAQQMFIAATACGIIFLILFLVRLLKSVS